MASMRLSLPLALVGSITSIFGALLGLALPANVVQTALGAVILAIVILMLRIRGRETPETSSQDTLSAARALEQCPGHFAGAAGLWRVRVAALGMNRYGLSYASPLSSHRRFL